MRKMKEWLLLRAFAATLDADDLLACQRFRLFKVGTLLSLLVLVGFLIQLQVVIPGRLFIFGIMCGLFVAVFLNYFLLAVYRRPRPAYLVLLVAWFLLIHINTWYSGGVRNSGNFYLATLIVTAFMLLGSRGGIITAITSVAHVVFFYCIRNSGWVNHRLVGEGQNMLDIYFLLSTSASLVLLTAQSVYIDKSKNEIIADLRAKSGVLARQNDELEKLSLVASQTSSGVAICNAAGHVEWANDAFLRIMGLTPGAVLG
ncbi:MAG: hypothetical protein EOO11_22870, partial [Chitinophagaceae bacterium]